MSVPLFSSSQRPSPVIQLPLPPFDPNDPNYGGVATSQPPEFQTPELRCDFGGLTLSGEYTFIPYVGALITNGPYKGLFIPWRLGANGTPPTTLMMPMLIMYPRPVQDAYFIEHCLRNYNAAVIACDGWNFDVNNFNMTTSVLNNWAAYCKSWGNKIVLWRGQPTIGDPFFRSLVAARLVDYYIVGTEMDKIPGFGSLQLPPILDQALIDGPGIPLGVHFTSNYPDGFPRDTFLAGGDAKSFADYNGKVHLFWQADQNDSAGKQAAMLYYARQRVQLGLIGGDGRVAPDCKIFIHEVMASNQLQGTCNEVSGNLRGTELMWAPKGITLTGNSGFLNGARLPNGDWLRRM